MPETSDRARLRQLLQRQTEALERRIQKLQQLSDRLSKWRLMAFLVGAFLFYGALYSESVFWILLVLAVAFSSFFLLVRNHNRVDRALDRFRIFHRIRLEHIYRMDLRWEGIPERPEHAVDASHAYARDLNIGGDRSLLQLMDTAHFKGGSERLKHWLLANRPDVENLRERQELVRELKRQPYFRDRLRLTALRVQGGHDEKDWDIHTLMHWLKQVKAQNYQPALGILMGLSGLNILLGALYAAGIVPPFFALTLVIYLIYYNFNGEKIKGLFEEAYQMEQVLKEFGAVMGYLEKHHYEAGSRLASFCAPFTQPDDRPSRFIRRITRLAAAASSQKNQVFWAVLNFIVPWDIFFSARLDRYKEELRPRLEAWLDKLSTLEALNSMANFAWLNPGYTFALPEADRSKGPVFEAEALGHPLIPADRKVTNDFRIDENGSVILITGSNMAGKSTFLRTVGINLCLCYAGAPVNASRLHTQAFRIFSSINITDSLNEGLSHFYAEVKRLRRLIEELNIEDSLPLFYFVDEIFRGTNNRERLLGSTAFIRHVAGRGGAGMISTHDLELASLEEEIESLHNYHFEETISEGRMRFEYKLHHGPCTSTNALKIMEMEGLPTPEDREQ